MRYIDLSHAFTIPMPVYPGDPTPEVRRIAELEKNGYVDHELKTAMHVGTHIDVPSHMVAHGEWIDEITLERFAGRGVLIDARGKSKIDEGLLSGVHIEKGDAMLVLTGFDKKYREKEYFSAFPEITEAFADILAEHSINMLGVDTPSPDREPFPAHHILLENDILILENLANLHELIGIPSFEVFAFPPKFHTEGAPVRVVARVP
ncbi:MAG: cyclase family protein [Patescibacteria group bacterium]